MPTDSALLADIPLFALLDDTERATLAAQLDVIEHKAGDLLFRVGDPGDALYIVRSGELEIFVQNDTGDQIVLAHTQAGEMTGELSLLDGGPRTASARVLADLVALRLDREDLNQFLLMRPSAAMDLLAGMGQRLRANTELLRHTATRNVNEEMEDKRTAIQKAADWIADFSGSIPFLMLHLVFFAVWIGLNVNLLPFLPAFDPFPFGLLTMAVSLEAIVLSVFVLLSQNRQAAKERIRADIEYDVNLKAELEVAQLHVKVDHLHAELLARLDAIEHGRQRV
jgi:CRP/FNR family transcriptional regulator, cyclic AMP receptor protein